MFTPLASHTSTAVWSDTWLTDTGVVEGCKSRASRLPLPGERRSGLSVLSLLLRWTWSLFSRATDFGKCRKVWCVFGVERRSCGGCADLDVDTLKSTLFLRGASVKSLGRTFPFRQVNNHFVISTCCQILSLIPLHCSTTSLDTCNTVHLQRWSLNAYHTIYILSQSSNLYTLQLFGIRYSKIMIFSSPNIKNLPTLNDVSYHAPDCY